MNIAKFLRTAFLKNSLNKQDFKSYVKIQHEVIQVTHIRNFKTFYACLKELKK